MRLLALSIALCLIPVAAATATADGGPKLSASLSSYHEVHFAAGPPAALRGAISSPARGTFRASVDPRGDTVHYELSYEGLTSAATQAHIHFGQRHTVGGIVVWLCQTAGTPAPASVAAVTPFCPQSGTVTGSFTAAQVLAQALQGFPAGDLDELLRAIDAGAAYANVHTQNFQPGEIRGAINSDNGRRD